MGMGWDGMDRVTLYKVSIYIEVVPVVNVERIEYINRKFTNKQTNLI
jgi:hypothetical protein